jgi:hypothetical protein
MNKKRICGVDPRARQQGVVLIIALIMLVIISLVVATAFTLGSSNLKSVGNVQARSEAVAAANSAIETVITGSFLGALNSTTNVAIDMNKDGVAEYNVAVAIPLCPGRVTLVAHSTPSGFETTFGASSAAGDYMTEWELTATVTDAVTGAQAVVREGIRLPIGETQYQSKVTTCGLTVIGS